MLKLAVWASLLVLTVALTLTYLPRYAGGPAAFYEKVQAISWESWIAVLGLTVVFYFLDFLRFYALLRIFGFRLPLAAGIQMTCISYFAASLTPSSELHLPAMVWFLMRQNVPAATATAVTLSKSLLTTFWICFLALLSGGLPGAALFPYALLPQIGFNVLLVAVVLFPKLIERWAAHQLAKPNLRAWKKKLVMGIELLASAFAVIRYSKDRFHLLCHLGCVAVVFVYSLIGWMLALQLGFDIGYGKSVAVFSNGLMIAYLSPVPGSMGVAEMSTAYLLDPTLSPSAVTVSIALRLLCWYLVIGPGALLTIYYLWLGAKRSGRRATSPTDPR